MTTDELKAWLLLAGFIYEYERYFYMRNGFTKIITVAVLVDSTVKVDTFAEARTYMDCSDAQRYIQSIIGD